MKGGCDCACSIGPDQINLFHAHKTKGVGVRCWAVMVWGNGFVLVLEEVGVETY